MKRRPASFAHPHCPWERGTNESTNLLIRQYLPKGKGSLVDPVLLPSFRQKLNTRPRKCLGFLSPAQVFFNLYHPCCIRNLNSH